MGQNNEESKGCSHPEIIAAFIGGFFAIIAAVIGAYAVFMAGNSGSNVPQQPESSSLSPTSAISGAWGGTIGSTDGSFQTDVIFFIQPDCVLGEVCGNYDAPAIGCKGDLIFQGVTQDIFEFVETKYDGAPDYCVANGVDRFTQTSDGQLRVSYLYTDSQVTRSSNGILTRK